MTTTPTTPGRATTPASTGPVAGLPAPGRRRQPVLVIVGLVLAALAAALVAAALNAASATTLVWSTAAAVARGQPVTAADLVAVEVAAGSADTLVAATVASREQLTGGMWAADLPAGQLVSPPLTVERLAVGAGQALVGLRLDPGGFPSTGLAPGDVVQVVASPAQQDQPVEVLVEAGTVEAVMALSEQGAAAPRLITVAVPADAAAAVASAGSAGRVSLVVVP